MSEAENDASSGANSGSEFASVDAFTVSFVYDRPLWRRAMTGWWRSVVPPDPFVKRAIFWAVVWFLIGALTLVLSLLEIPPSFVFAGLIGAGFLVGIFGYLQRTRMSRFWDVVGSHWDKAGETEAVFSANGVTFTDAVSRRELSWEAIDAVKGMRGVTVLRSGISMIAVPDANLPVGMDAAQFRARINAWRGRG